MKKVDELVKLIEKAYLDIKFDTHVEVWMTSGTNLRDANLLRSRIADDLLAKVRPLLEQFAEENFTK